VTPSHLLVNAWRSVLGDDKDADTSLDLVDNCISVANSDQTDSDRNGVGDACGPTFAQGTVGGSVPATLSLTLGAPASFGAFTAGKADVYTATTTATVTSSAGDAALSVADPSTDHSGYLVNGAFALAQPLQGLGTVKIYPAPVSNDVAPVTFKQAIGVNDALRTGAYSKTLTFTLSTTTP
jgi:hypothetical protein